MEFLEKTQNYCRICLEQPGSLDWNDELLVFCGVTYKYCYYKYTQLDYADNFSEMLCESCSTDLMNAHFLLLKAIESHKSLQQTVQRCQTDDTEEQKYSSMQRYQTDFTEEQKYSSIQRCQTDATEEQKYSNEFDPAYFETVFIEQLTDSSFEDNYNKNDIVKTLTEIPNKQKDELKQNDEFKSADISQSQINLKSSSKQERVKENSSKARRKKSHIMCTHCSKLIVAEYIKLHEETHKEQRERTEMCPKCGIKLYNKKTLYSHMLTHKENREKKYKCEFCDKSYFNRGALNVHRRIHLGEMFSCLICSKEFYRQIDLDKHNYKVHSTSLLHTNVETPTYYVECKDCGKNIPSRRWKFHRDTHLNKFQMQCTLCDKHFVSKKTCHQHVTRTHKRTKDDFAKVVKYYGDNINNRTSHLMIEQTEKVKPTLE